MPRKMKKMPKDLLQMMEWNKLGKIYYIHRDFLQYADIQSIISMCCISKHYYKKYFLYSIQYYFATNTDLLYSYKKYYFQNYYIPKNLDVPKILSVYVCNNMETQYKVNELKTLYQKCKTFQLIVNKHFECFQPSLVDEINERVE